MIYEEGTLDRRTLLEALNSNFQGFEELRRKLLECPQMGNNDDYVDQIASQLMDEFAEYLNKKKNNRGGIFRAGTGSITLAASTNHSY